MLPASHLEESRHQFHHVLQELHKSNQQLQTTSSTTLVNEKDDNDKNLDELLSSASIS